MTKNRFRSTPIATSAAWRELHDRLSSGVYHELNGRYSAFASLLQIVGFTGEVSGSTLEELHRETERLGACLQTLRTIPRYERVGPELVDLSDLLRRLCAVASQERNAHRIEFQDVSEPGLPPVSVEKDVLSMCLLVLLATSAREAQKPHGDETVVARGGVGEGGVTVQIVVPAAPTEEGPQPVRETKEQLPQIAEDGLEAVRSTIEAAGLKFRVEAPASDGFAMLYTVVIPTVTS